MNTYLTVGFILLGAVILFILLNRLRGKDLQCIILGHDWDRPTYFDEFSSSILDYKKCCRRCKLSERWVKHKPAPYQDE